MPIDPALDQGPYQSRLRHPACAEEEKRDYARRYNEEKRRRAAERRASTPPPPAPRPEKREAPRNPNRSDYVERVIRRVDAGPLPRDDPAEEARALRRLERSFGRAS